MQRSKLEDIYSLSGKLTCKEMIAQFDSDVEAAWMNDRLEYGKYIDQFTGKVKSEYSINRDQCPLCYSKEYRFLFLKDGFDHMICNSCDMVFTLQLLDQNKMPSLAVGDEGSAYGDYKEDKTVNDLDRKKYEIVLEQLEQYSSIKKIFDIGSSAGTFLDWAHEKYDIVGHEYHDDLRKHVVAKGHKMFSENLATIEFDEEFDLITIWDYLDHVTNPIESISNISKYLKKGGLFFFAINNLDSLSVRILHQDSPIFSGPHHTMHFGINQLKKLMKDFEFLHSESYVSELNWISNWLDFKNPAFGDAKLKYELFDPNKICELGLGFKVNAIFRKN